MERAGHVAPFVFVEVVDEEAVVDGVGMFVEENENVDGIFDVGAFFKLNLGGIEAVCEKARFADHRVHGDAAGARAIGGLGTVAGAFIDFGVGGEVSGEFRFGDIKSVGVVVGSSPVEDVVDPVGAVGADLVAAVIVDVAVVMVVRILVPGKVELLDVVEAGDALRFGFGLAEGRQQHAGKNGDDRDNHEKFDQSEGVAVGRRRHRGRVF
jgi:hypothetical protein